MSEWESDPLVFAIDANGQLVHIDSVKNGSACGCVCPSCEQPLVAKNGGEKLVHHFAHQRGACKWAAETAVVLLLKSILENEKRMYVEGARCFSMEDFRSYRFSPDGLIDVQSVALVDACARQAPAIAISGVDEHGTTCDFLLVTTLAQRLSEEELQQLRSDGRCVLNFDLKGQYSGMRDAEGRHFSRRDFFQQVQSPAYLQEVLMDEDNGGILQWIIHPQCEKEEAEENKRYREKRDAEWEAWLLKLRREEEERQHEEERRRLKAEQEQAEAERRRAESQRIAIERERQAFEDEGVEALLMVKRGIHHYVDECPLYGSANVTTDCGAYSWSSEKCIFFEGQRYFLIGCTARQNGVGLDDE